MTTQVALSALANTAVTAGVYGGAQLARFTVDAQGRLTSAANVSSSTFFVDSAGDVGIGTSNPTQPLDVNGNIAITGNARRIFGDFTNSTLTNRVMFQTSTTNGATTITALPNGTSTTCTLLLGGKSDIDNAPIIRMISSDSDAQLRADALGTSSYVPLSFWTGNSKRVEIGTSGNLQFDSGYGSVATAYGCRAWVTINASSGTPSIKAQGNVTSIGDNGTGDFTMNFTNAMPDADYVALGRSGDQGQTGGGAIVVIFNDSTHATQITASSYRFLCATEAGTLRDPANIAVAIIR